MDEDNITARFEALEDRIEILETRLGLVQRWIYSNTRVSDWEF